MLERNGDLSVVPRANESAELVVQSLMIAFAVVMLDELVHPCPEMPFPQAESPDRRGIRDHCRRARAIRLSA
jgi:hypothetical protein